MADNKKLECLIRLQSVITEKLNLENQREMIPQSLREDESDLKKASEILEGYEEDLRQAESEEKSLAIQYADANNESSEYQKVVETLSTQREFEAMTKQINEAEARAKSLLTAKRAKDEQIKDLKGRIAEQTEAVNTLTQKVDEKKAVVEAETADIEGKIAALDGEIDLVKGGVIDEEFFARFYNIARKKNGEGLVPVKGQVCMGCNTVLPMQFVIDLRLKQLKDEVDTCPYCSRLIYFDDTLPPEEEKNYIFDDIEMIKSISKGGESAGDEGQEDDSDLLVADDGDEDF